MIAVMTAALFGMLQMYLLSVFTACVTCGNTVKAVVFLFVKIILYGVSVTMMVFLLRFAIIYCAVGYVIGLPLCAVIIFYIKNVRNKKRKGDSGLETVDDN